MKEKLNQIKKFCEENKMTPILTFAAKDTGECLCFSSHNYEELPIFEGIYEMLGNMIVDIKAQKAQAALDVEAIKNLNNIKHND